MNALIRRSASILLAAVVGLALSGCACVKAPVLTGLSPDEGAPGTTVDITVTGQDFETTIDLAGATLSVDNVFEGTPEVTVVQPDPVVSSTQFTARLRIAPNAEHRAYEIRVVNFDEEGCASFAGVNQRFSGPINFFVSDPAHPTPRLFQLETSAPLILGTSVSATLYGANFDATATVTGLQGVSNVVFQSSTNLTMDITIPADASTGGGAIQVTTGNGASNPLGYIIQAPPSQPVIELVSPNFIFETTVTNLTLIGSNFVAGVTVASGRGMETATFIDDRHIDVLTAATAPGDFQFRATTVGGESDPATVRVLPAGTATPRFDRHLPLEDLMAGSEVYLELQGRNFGTGPASLLWVAGPTGVIEKSAALPSDSTLWPTKRVVRLAIAPDAEPGHRELFVQASTGLISGPELSGQGFDVLATPTNSTTPFINSASLSSLNLGDSTILSLFGGNLAGADFVDFNGTGVTITNVAASFDGTEVQFEISVATNAAPTGDAATNFRVGTPRGFSNWLAFQICDPAVGCGGSLPLRPAKQAETSERNRFQVMLSPVWLNGAYPFIVAGERGLLSVATDTRGRLAGTVEMEGRHVPVTGRIRTRNNFVRLHLRGEHNGRRAKIAGELHGHEFVGLIGGQPFALDVAGVARLKAAVDLNLNRAVVGPVSIPVRVSNHDGVLTIRGRNFYWRGDATHWIARGFGASVSGSGLSIPPEMP